jgi:hypothetical protein
VPTLRARIASTARISEGDRFAIPAIPRREALIIFVNALR